MKKKGIQILLAIILVFNVNYSFSQFYDVKKVRRLATIKPITENSTLQIFSKNEASLPMEPTPSATVDTLAANELEKELLSPPLDTLIVSSHYGYRNDPFTGKRKFHHGTDFLTNSDNVYSMMPGRVRKIGYNKVLGNYIEIDHGDFRVTYAHLHTVIGEKGDFVRAGQSIGISGSTGRSTGEHLHLSMRFKNKSVDPYPLVKYIRDWSKRMLKSQPADTLKVPDEGVQPAIASIGQP